MDKAKPLFSSAEAKELFAKLSRAWEDYEVLLDKIIDLSKSTDPAATRTATELSLGQARAKINIVDDAFTELSRRKEANAKEYSDLTTQIYTSSRAVLLSIIAGSMASVRACQERSCQGKAVPIDAITWQEQMTPCLSLRALLGVSGKRPHYERIIIARCEGEDIGLAVDAVIGQQQAVIKPLSDVIRDADFISGTAVNGDGGIALILDIARLMRYAAARYEPIKGTAPRPS